MHATSPGIPNTQFEIRETNYWYKRKSLSAAPLPIVTLEPKPLANWARVIARAEDTWVPGFKLATSPKEERVSPSLSAAERVQRFRENASPLAYSLAGLLTTVPINLPIIRLIQRTMLPASDQVHLAEVFLGGLLKVASANSATLDPDYIQYDFVEGVRELLLPSVSISDTARVLAKIGDFIEENFGNALDFRALLTNPLATEGISISKESLPFAKVAARVLRTLGSDYASLADWLEKTANEVPAQEQTTGPSIDVEKIASLHRAGGQVLREDVLPSEQLVTGDKQVYASAEQTDQQVVGSEEMVENDTIASEQLNKSRDGGLASTKPNPAIQSLVVDFPERVESGEVTSLLVWLTASEPGSIGISEASLPQGTTIDIVVQARRGFALEGRGEGSLVITDAQETLPLQFKLRSTALGLGQVDVLFLHDGVALGAMMITPTVIEQSANTQTASSRSHEQALAPVSVRLPNLSLLIEETWVNGRRALALQITSSNPSHNLYLAKFGPIFFQTDPGPYFQGLYEDIEDYAVATPTDLAITAQKLAAKGVYLFRTLLPPEAQSKLWELKDQVTSVLVQSEEPWIPWELCKLSGKENGQMVRSFPV
jgi:hypothetical protein